MKKRNFPALIFAFALVVLSAACGQTANVDHSKMDHNSMNHNSMPMNSAMNQNSMPMNSNMNHNSMDHSAMKSDPNAASAPFDLQFIDTMSQHHQGAIEMSETALKKSANDELKKFAQKIIDDQKKEITQLATWRKTWFAEAPPARNMEMPGMSDSMKMMNADHMKMMDAMTGADYDIHFLDMMIPHHQGAVAMAKEALQKSEKAEIKTLANAVIKAQEAEIKQMNDWKAKWAK
jgi:uncharacterized protein (DUF305 family)